MRRSDREITDINDILEVIEKCDVCRLALNDGEYPYILPLNFGMQMEDEKIILYFHGAKEGKKYELIAKDNRASFEMDCSHNLITDKTKESCTCTMAYESVVGFGKIELIPEHEKYNALCLLMKHYHKENVSFNQLVMQQTIVFKLVVEHISGKIHK